jgi:hypothetical protein
VESICPSCNQATNQSTSGLASTPTRSKSTDLLNLTLADAPARSTMPFLNTPHRLPTSDMTHDRRGALGVG